MVKINLNNFQNDLSRIVYRDAYNRALSNKNLNYGDLSLFGFTNQAGIKIKDLFSQMNTSLEGGDDGNDANNSISQTRYDQIDNTLYFEAKDGSIIQYNLQTGKVGELGDQDDFLQVANNSDFFGKGNTVSDYDVLDFGNNSITALNYNFGTDPNESKYANYENYKDVSINIASVANGTSVMQNAINGVANDTKFTSLDKVFGHQQDNAGEYNNKTTYINDTTMVVSNTDGRNYVVKYDTATGKVSAKTLSTEAAASTDSKDSNIQKFDLQNNSTGFSAAVNSFISDMGGYSKLDNGLKDLFGADSNVTFSKDNNKVYIQQNGETYILSYDKNTGATVKSYSFDTDGAAAAGDSKNRSLINLTTADGQNQLQNILDTSYNDTGKFIGYSNIFGSNRGNAENHYYSLSGNNMIAVQSDRAFITSYSDTANKNGSHFTQKELTLADLKNKDTGYAKRLGVADDVLAKTTSVKFYIKSQAGDKPPYELGVKCYDANGKLLNDTSSDSGDTGLSGDPHFSYEGKQAFDLQGAGGGTNGQYSLLKGDGFNLTANFTKFVDKNDYATGMSEENLSVTVPEGTITVTNNTSGCTIKLNNDTITADDAKKYGVIVSTSGKNATITFSGRSVNLNNSSNYGSATCNGWDDGDTGLLTQTKGAANESSVKDTDYNQTLVYSINSAISAPVVMLEGEENTESYNKLAKDFLATLDGSVGRAYVDRVLEGAIDSKDQTALDYNYNPENDTTRTTAQKSEYLARLAQAAIKSSNGNAQKITALWIDYSNQAMKEDIASGDKALAKKFVAGHGYSRSQWDEYVGTAVYGTSVDVNKDGKQDKGIDVDNNGVIDGYDLDGDGILEDNERLAIDLNDIFKKSAQDQSDWVF